MADQDKYKKNRKNIYLTDDALKRLDRIGKNQKLTNSATIEQALEALENATYTGKDIAGRTLDEINKAIRHLEARLEHNQGDGELDQQALDALSDCRDRIQKAPFMKSKK